MSSILTNNGAMVALQTLKGINANLGKTQEQISTGKAIGTAKDNAAIWAVAKGMESEVGGLKSISTGLSLGAQAVGTARQASEKVTELLKEVRNLVVQAQDGNVDRATLKKDIEMYRGQIASVVGSSEFNKANLINGSDINGSTATYKVTSSMTHAAGANPTTIDVTRVDLSEAGELAGFGGTGLQIDTDANAAAALAAVDGMIAKATEAAQNFGSAGKRIDIQGDFISKLSDSMTAGVGALVDANMEEASARLQALQTQQQLGIQSLSIANQAPQSILSLFR